MAKGMESWMAWAAKCGDKLVDLGNPLEGGQKLSPDGSSEQSRREVAGYSILQAENIDDAKALLRATFRGANRVQAGLDVAFDIFITISWILFGINIAKSPSFNKILGWAGSLVALSLLVLNLSTFPNGPAESGLFDLGPFLGLWALVFYIWFFKVTTWRPNQSDVSTS